MSNPYVVKTRRRTINNFIDKEELNAEKLYQNLAIYQERTRILQENLLDQEKLQEDRLAFGQLKYLDEKQQEIENKKQKTLGRSHR